MSSNTHFVFHHKVFSVEGGYFSARKGGADARFHVPMGDVMASIPIDTLHEKFEIETGSDDSRLLEVVRSALKYVKVIRVNDAIPSELLDGTASWSVDERHRLIARCRLAFQLIDWVLGDEAGTTNFADFMRKMETPAVKAKIREAVEKVGRDLGIAEDPVGTIEKRLETLAHELSYIEGLRDRFREIQGIQGMAQQGAAADGQGQRIREDCDRIRVLLSLSFKRIGSEFDLIIKQCDNITKLLGDTDTFIQLIRAARDDIRVELKAWDEVIDDWQALMSNKTDLTVAQVTERTYRFLAQNYPINQVW